MFKLKKNTENNEEIVKAEPPKETKQEEISSETELKTDASALEEQTVSVQSVTETETKGKKKEEKKEEKKVIKWGPNRVLQCFAYFSVVLIAIAMILRLIFKNQPDIAIYMQGVGECLAYIVCIWLGFYFTRKRGNIWWLIGWIIASVILVIFYIFAIV